ncbi:MAG TPA: GNAT family N-acetyltransferase [Marmoricola sp.]|nr:GNAT family N-acetyltransferase [Marmoricola sp.]
MSQDEAVQAARRQRMLDQARAGIAVLEQRRTDPVGRGLLGQAVEELGDDLPDWVLAARERLLAPVPPRLPLRTERLVLRRPRMEDLDALHSWYGREEVARYLLTHPLSRDQMEVELRKRSGPPETRPDILPLVVEYDGRVVGDLVLMIKPPAYSQAEIGWTLHPDHAGRGIATEAARALLDLAFGHYGLHRVHADLDARNDRSRAMCERLGMRLETHALQDFWSKGEWTDTCRYALLREEHAGSR